MLAAFAEARVSPWTVASWFVTPQALLDDQTPAGWLAAEGEVAVAVESARRVAAKLER